LGKSIRWFEFISVFLNMYLQSFRYRILFFTRCRKRLFSCRDLCWLRLQRNDGRSVTHNGGNFREKALTAGRATGLIKRRVFEQHSSAAVF
jgi:hypothetical protein